MNDVVLQFKVSCHVQFKFLKPKCCIISPLQKPSIIWGKKIKMQKTHIGNEKNKTKRLKKKNRKKKKIQKKHAKKKTQKQQYNISNEKKKTRNKEN
jgi:hypothetical protein